MKHNKRLLIMLEVPNDVLPPPHPDERRCSRFPGEKKESLGKRSIGGDNARWGGYAISIKPVVG